MPIQKRSISPSPVNASKSFPKQGLKKSSSEESIRIIQKAVLFPSTPQTDRVIYVRRTLESDAELIRRQQAVIALQPLTFAEELAAKRKQLEIRAEKRKLGPEKAEAKQKDSVASEITAVPAPGKTSPSRLYPTSPTKMKVRTTLKEATKPSAAVAISNRQQRSKLSSQPGIPGGRQDRSEGPMPTKGVGGTIQK